MYNSLNKDVFQVSRWGKGVVVFCVCVQGAGLNMTLSLLFDVSFKDTKSY